MTTPLSQQLQIADPIKAEVTRLVGSGMAWPLAQGLAPWTVAVDSAGHGEMVVLVETVRTSVLVLMGWIEETGAALMALRAACAASLALAEVLDNPRSSDLYEREARAREALRAFSAVLRTARPNLWVRKHGLGW